MSSSFPFNLPPQDLAAPSQFAPRPEALTRWLESLPKTNLGQTSRSLYLAVTELNRVRLTPANRLPLLETLRPAVYLVNSGLRRHYLNQPIMLPEQAEKVSRLAHVLFQQLATGYAMTALQGLELGRQSGFNAPQQALATCIHRALTELSQNLLRDLSLYRDAQPGSWHQLHQLAQLAWQQGIEQIVVADGQNGDGNIEAVYLRALLLGSAKTHQLRQEDQPRVFRQLLGWSRNVSLCGPGQGLFVIDPAGDSGPVYREFIQAAPGWLGLDTRALAQQLTEQRAELAAAGGELGESALSSDLLGHLIHTWSTASKRAFLRMESNEEVDIALGLAATHHFLAGEIHFNQLLTSTGTSAGFQPKGGNPFLRGGGTPASLSERRPVRNNDVWDSIYSQRSSFTQVSLETIDYHIDGRKDASDGSADKERYRSHRVHTVNLSPGGFCLRWPPENPTQIRTGEIVGLRENTNRSWSVGVVRWVRLLGSGPQLGIEMLAPTAAPYGARVVNKTGAQGDWLRVLVLPELSQIGQPATLITPRLPFREGQKVELQVRDRLTRIQLGRRLASSSAFSQFEFHRLGTAPRSEGEAVPATGHGEGFESLWDNL